MPWKVRSPMEQREEFVLLAKSPGANVSALCRAFGISRKTGYKWLKRYEERGVAGLREMSRKPRESPLKVSGKVVAEVVRVRAEHGWGARKIRVVLLREGRLNSVPSERTINRILERCGLRGIRRRRSSRLKLVHAGAPDTTVERPNQLWTVDFKGWWLMRDGERAEPLTVRDAYSRYVLCVRVLPSTALEPVRETFEQLFQAFGLPESILSDNGSPFASSKSIAGLSRLSAWWTVLGIRHLRSRPGKPQDNGGHERMHLDIARELEAFAAMDAVRQQEACERWRWIFDYDRPHEALGLKVPADLYRPGPGWDPCPIELVYPERFEVRRVTRRGTVKWKGHTRFLSQSLAGYQIAFERIDIDRIRLWLAELPLGTCDHRLQGPIVPPDPAEPTGDSRLSAGAVKGKLATLGAEGAP